ncbi:MAG: hypothetical protein KDI36_12145 [Pseudomonadales bacterium]|nr:hypothetical protein [Pseudomonadales bacterium]
MTNPVVPESLEFELVWDRQTDEIREAAISYWAQQNILPAGTTPEERCNELLMLVRDHQQQRVIGVATATLYRLPEIGEVFYRYRNHVIPDIRFQLIGTQLVIAGFEQLEAINGALGTPEAVGMYLEIENLALMRARNYGIWPNSRFSYIGRTSAGWDRRIRYFAGARQGTT